LRTVCALQHRTAGSGRRGAGRRGAGRRGPQVTKIGRTDFNKNLVQLTCKLVTRQSLFLANS